MLRVVDAGVLSTVQDLGRPGLAHLGVPIGGACDPWSLVMTNRLLGNDDGAAVLEMTLLGATLAVEAGGSIAIGGADLEAEVVEDGRRLSPGRSHRVEAGTTLRFGAAVRGVRAYLAVPGGIDVEPVLGSRSTCLAGGFGGIEGRAIAAGDRLAPSRAPTRAPSRAPSDTPADAPAGRAWPAGGFDPTDQALPIRLIPVRGARGVHAQALDALVGGIWTVSPVGDRTGLRLEGKPLTLAADAGDLVSSAMLPGAIQLPPSGEPIVLLADGPTIGGYPVPAVVATADLPIVAQREPGEPVRFVAVDAEAARDAARARRLALAAASGSGRGPVPYSDPT